MKNYLSHAFRALMSIAKSFTRLVAKLGWSTHAAGTPTLKNNNPTILVVSIVMLLSLAPTPVLATSHTEVQKSLDASQVTDGIPDQLDSPAKEERREWQSQASSIREDEDNIPSTLSEKLNLDELAKGYDPEREAEKRSVPMP